MGARRKRWRRILIVSPFIFLVLLLGMLHLFSDFGLSETEIRSRFEAARVPYELKTVQGVSFVETGNPEGRVVVFVHGSPGSWDNFISYLLDEDLRKTCRLIALNRPGYCGDSRGRPEPSLQKQAEAVMKIVPEGASVLAVGHSMGGPIIVRLAADYPERVDGLLLLSAALDPALERVMWIQHIGKVPLIAWMLPATLDVCNRELIPLRGELERLEPEWKQLAAPVLALHGEQDGLVPVANMDYLRQQMGEERAEIRILEDENHFIPWTRQEDVKQALQDLVAEASSHQP